VTKTEDAPQPKPAQQPQQTSHLSLINSLASANTQDEGFAGYKDDGTPMFGDKGMGFLHAPHDDMGLQFTQLLNQARGMSPMSAHTAQMISLQMVKNAREKVESMTLQLEPAHLGKLEIRMSFDDDGGFRARLTADKPETLAALQRDAGHLHRALHEAGFDLDDAALSFDLRQDNPQHGQRELGDARDNNGRSGNGFENILNGGEDIPLAANIAAQMTGYITPSGVNIMV
jgi:flagellar hook-length control protein FliK